MITRQLVCGVASGLLISVAGLGSVVSASAQQVATIAGTVVAEDTGEPLVGADVTVEGTARGSVTDAQGRYRLETSPGTYTLGARYIGYEEVEQRVSVATGETATADFRLPRGALLVDQIVVVGSRTSRTSVETPVPVDVITETEVRTSGQTEVNQILRDLVPSFNASHQTIADGSDHINPASLRGLGPDQVLVLVNGKRRHPSSLVHVNGTFGRGTVGVDLNAIPPAAIKRIEVLRDGASAQYGSDAIAGVINLVLRDQAEALEGTVKGSVTGEGDGEEALIDANYGFRVGERGYFNVTGEYLDRARTDRSDPFTGDIFPGITGKEATDAELASRRLTREDFSMKTGQSAARSGMAFFNSAMPIGQTAELYAFGGISHRDGEATGFYRLPNQRGRVVPEIHPNGFLPEIHTTINDRSVSAGLRGSRRGWDYDFSVTHGGNRLGYNIENSNNASMGTASPTTFDAGGFELRQTTGNLDAVRLIDTGGALKSLSLVAGGEFRIENYEIFAGEDASWQLGNGGTRPGIDFDTLPGGAPKEPGSQVFPGFQPANEVDRSRNSISGYLGFETQVSDRLLVDVGGRYENYSDFGSTVTGKLAGRYEVAPGFALRGAVSNGFRAPSLHQTWFNNVSIQFVVDPVTSELVPSRVLTSNNLSRVTKAFGIPDLEEETSVNLSAGVTAKPAPNLSITADLYRIMIDDRIVLTSRFSNRDPVVAQILAPFRNQGVNEAQFFANAVDTETTGLDIVATYVMRWLEGTMTLTGSGNLTKTEVTAVHVPPELAQKFAGGDLERVRNTIFDREERNRLEDALPRQKFTLSSRYETGPLSVLARGTYYGEIKFETVKPELDETFGAKTLFDLDVGYEFLPGLKLSAGGSNLFNTFPDKHENPANISDGRFPFSRRVTQFGSNGGFYYARLQYRL
ncbi:MAG: TonB-dependent receptor domain-containing protein [Gemmatimonadota bacterium]